MTFARLGREQNSAYSPPKTTPRGRARFDIDGLDAQTAAAGGGPRSGKAETKSMTLTEKPVSFRLSSAQAAINALVAVALGVCVFCGWQWVEQTRLRARVEQERRLKLAAEKVSVEEEAQSRRYSAEIARLDILRKDLQQKDQDNQAALRAIREELGRDAATNQFLAKEFARLTNANAEINAAILQKNPLVKAQNEQFSGAADERNAVVKKYNELAANYEKTVKQYNDLVDQITKERQAIADKEKEAEKK